jgi:hypothetical protein
VFDNASCVQAYLTGGRILAATGGDIFLIAFVSFSLTDIAKLQIHQNSSSANKLRNWLLERKSE